MLATWGASSGFNVASLFAAGEQGAWYDPSDNTTMFQDAAGTTPVTAVEQAVGSALDKRSPTGYSVFFDGTGDYLNLDGSAGFAFGTGDFTIEFWINFASLTNQQNIVDFRSSTGVGNGIVIYKSSPDNFLSVFADGSLRITGSALLVSTWYHVAVTRSGTSTKLFLNGTQTGSTFTDTTNYTVAANAPSVGSSFTTAYINGYISNLRIVKGTAVYTGNFTPPISPLTAISGTSLLTCGNSWTSNPTITRNGDTRVIGLNPFGATVGNHAYQTTAASRPILRSRYNLLTYSEEFDNAAWTKQNLNTTGTPAWVNVAVAPDGTTTADKLIENTATAAHGVVVLGVFSGTAQKTNSIYAKAAERTRIALGFSSSGGLIVNTYAVFDVLNGTIVTQPSGTSTASITSVGNGWYRISLLTNAASVGEDRFVVNILRDSDTAPASYTGDGTSGILVWGAQASYPAVFPSNTYQRIAASTDYATGAAFPQYLSFDGTDDSLLTASVDFTGTDKMTVWSGVTKQSDAATGVLSELSSQWDANAGSFAVIGAIASATAYGWRTTGSSLVNTSINATPYTAPITNVVTGIGDISGDLATIRVNGVQAATSSSDQGTGNFGNYPLYIGRRNNATLPLNGRIYSLIVRGAASNSTQIAQTERYVAAKTPLGVVP